MQLCKWMIEVDEFKIVKKESVYTTREFSIVICNLGLVALITFSHFSKKTLFNSKKSVSYSSNIELIPTKLAFYSLNDEPL